MLDCLGVFCGNDAFTNRLTCDETRRMAVNASRWVAPQFLRRLVDFRKSDRICHFFEFGPWLPCNSFGIPSNRGFSALCRVALIQVNAPRQFIRRARDDDRWRI